MCHWLMKVVVWCLQVARSAATVVSQARVELWIWAAQFGECHTCTLELAQESRCGGIHGWRDLDHQPDNGDTMCTEKERKMTPMLPLAWIMVLLHLRVGLTCTSNPKTCITRVRGPLKNTAAFQRWTPWTWVDKQAYTYLNKASP